MVVISNGFSKFHLSAAAAEADKRGLLTAFVTGSYPTPSVKRLLSLPWLRRNAKANRLAARRELITDEHIHPLFAAEALYEFGMLRHSDTTIADSFRLYGRLAIPHVRRAAANGARIYHFRSGFGGASLDVARKLGMFLLCDHASPHPAVEESLVENRGKMPVGGDAKAKSAFYGPGVWDLERADALLVNSHYVEESFREFGFTRIPVHTVYLGVDDSFLANVPERAGSSDDLRLLFAGNFEKRKGAEMLLDAIRRLGDFPWRLEVAGPISPAMAEQSRTLFSNPRVKHLGMLSRSELASAMARADVFVFPSLSEGSARVVFEALACGCFVITTPNSGSIVEDGVHGTVIPPGDGPSLAKAIESANARRSSIAEIGRNNSLLVKSQYKQINYGDKLEALYRKLLGKS